MEKKEDYSFRQQHRSVLDKNSGVPKGPAHYIPTLIASTLEA